MIQIRLRAFLAIVLLIALGGCQGEPRAQLTSSPNVEDLSLPPFRCADHSSCPDAVGELVTISFRGLQTCTATLVASDLILTASHCVPWENLNSQHKFLGNCWVRWPDTPTAVPCDHLREASHLGADVRQHIYRDLAYIGLRSPDTSHRPRKPLSILRAQQPTDEGLLFGIELSSREHVLRSLRCQRDDSFKVPKVQIDPGSAIIFPSCRVLHGYSGGPILDPSSRSIIGVISGVVGFDEKHPDQPVISIGSPTQL